jgi:dihydrofolate reductase
MGRDRERPAGTIAAPMGETTIVTEPFTAAVFIATSLDGYIARLDGDIGWLTGSEDLGDTGYAQFMAGIDLLVMGRGTYEKALTFDAWPYEGRRVLVLSTRLATADERVDVCASLDDLFATIADARARRVYIDGGKVIQSFLRAGRIAELTITRVPILLGEGLPLFGAIGRDVRLRHRATRVLGAGFVQSTYEVMRST